MHRLLNTLTLCLAGCTVLVALETAPLTKHAVQLDDIPAIGRVVVESQFDGFESGVDRDRTGRQLAYDYSVHLLWDTDWKLYRMYTGGRWRRPGIPYADGDHILQHLSKTGRGGTWFSRGQPEFWLGQEEGHLEGWWVKNYLEPEVVKVDQTYYMFWQVMIRKGDPVDTGEIATTKADRIGLATSSDGLHWERKIDRGIVLGVDQPADTKLTHQEVIYVADDPDDKPWWLYLFYIVDGKPQEHVRMRSATPDTFQWAARESCVGMAQIGNQIAYANDTQAGRIFVRITFVAHPTSKRRVPCLQFSRDGLHWTFGSDGRALLAGSRNNERNQNCYFLGLSTINGTGELERTADGTYHAIYGATTSSTPMAPEIFHSEVGVGSTTIQFLNP